MEKFPGMGSHYLKDGGQTGKITRRTTTGKVVVRLTERHEVALEPTCCAVVGESVGRFHFNEIPPKKILKLSIFYLN